MEAVSATNDATALSGGDLRRRFAPLIWVPAVALVVLVLTAAGLAYRIQTTWARAEQRATQRSDALTDLAGAVGYGGMIHHVKNYILRATPEYRTGALASITDARSAVERYRSLAELTPDETESLASIVELLNRYEAALANADRAGPIVASRDAAARVADAPFEAAIATLRDSVSDQRDESRLAFERELAVSTAIGSVVGLSTLGVVAFGGRRRLRRHASEVEATIASLHHAERLVHETGRVANIGGWMVDLETMTPIWSAQVRRIHEVDPDYQPDLESAINFYAPEARPVIQKAVEHGIATGEPWDVQVPLVTAKGRRIWVRALGQPEMKDGKCVRLWGAFQDVTEFVRATNELEELQSRFERAIAGTSDGLWDFDLLNDRAWYSDQFKRLVGIPDEELDAFGTTPGAFIDLLHPDDRQPTIDAAMRQINDGVPYDTEYRLLMRDGSFRWVRARGSRTLDDAGRAVSISGTLTDIHERRTAESRLDLTTRAARLGLWDWDVTEGQVHYNDTYFTMLGFGPDEMERGLEAWQSLVHPDDIEGAMEQVRRHFARETPLYSAEFRMRRKDGTWTWLRGAGEVVERDVDGSPKRMLGVHIDIQEARAALAEAEEANRAKSDFLANMSHEIRTPMTAILGYADLLTTDHPTDPQATEELVQTVYANAKHLLAVIDDVLDVSKIEAGRMRIECLDTRVSDVVEQLTTLSQPRARAKNLKLVVHLDPDVPDYIHTDPTRLKQILFNLTSNAVKFTDRGEITIAFAYQHQTSTLSVRVTDTGIGMTPEERDRVARFEAFAQADASTTRRFGGSGLGLRISNALAEMLGGRIDVESEAGVGSAFTVRIKAPPVGGTSTPDRAPQQTEQPASADTPPPLTGVTVLVAEDGPDNQRLFQLFLTKAGARVIICENGQEALDEIISRDPADQPDLVLMDMQMPVLDGYSATRQLREARVTIPIIAVTAHAMSDDRRKCLEAGCDDYVSKPIDRAALIELCARLNTSPEAGPRAA